MIARGVNHTFGSGGLEKQVLFEVDLQLDAGEVVMLSGPSGSGKTTLLTLIGALRTLQDGEMTVLGCDLRRASEKDRNRLRRGIGFVFQQHNLLGFLTARQNVELMFQLHPKVSRHEARRRTEDMLAKVGLEDHLNEHSSHLSGGQQQRVSIARALVGNPRLILADEPTAALDSQTGRRVVDLLSELAVDNGCSVLIVTHDARVLDAAHRIVTIEDGAVQVRPGSQGTGQSEPRNTGKAGPGAVLA
ncbi:MAG: ATP-binding cassette domain-containing protein [Acidobacteriota bacterium]